MARFRSFLSKLAELLDVSVPSPTDGQVLTFVGADQKWEAKTPSIAGTGISNVTWLQYVGTGAFPHVINLGFRPKFVVIFNEAVASRFFGMWSLSSDGKRLAGFDKNNASLFPGDEETSGVFTYGTATGLDVGQMDNGAGTAVNTLNDTYDLLAFG